MENILNNAYELMKKEISSEKIFDILKSGNDINKAAAILRTKEIKDKKFANILISHLTNHHGQIREICAYKINELLPLYSQYFQDHKTLDNLIAALNDVNPNVVRYILTILRYIENKEYIFNELLIIVKNLSSEVLNKPRRGKVQEHIFTKKCFKIYWTLESLKVLISLKSDIIEYDKDNFKNILEKLCRFEEYTIREKIAQILGLLESNDYNEIREKIENDNNFFVSYANKRGQNENFISR